MVECIFLDNMIVEICGNLMLGGGYVVIFIDVIVFCCVEDVFKCSNEMLECCV